MIGETIGNFRVIKHLGTGGMGEVWLGEQLSIGTHVAIKILNAAVSNDTEHVQRFFNEARAVSRIQHAGIVKIFDVGMHTGQAYLIMEYLDGETLSKRFKRGRLSFAEIGEIGRQIAIVLDATHTAGVTHRDLKPDNIFLVPDSELGERVKILDFGIAKLTGTLAGVSPRTMGTMGTPAYMAPEQWGDTSKVDWRADLYSLGCVAFEMTTGRLPFVANTMAEACGKHLNERPPNVSSLAPTVPAGLEKLIARLLEKDPAKRPASMLDVASAFAALDKQALGTAPTITTEPVSLPSPHVKVAKRSSAVPVLLGVLALGAGAAGAVFALKPGSSPSASTSNDADGGAERPTTASNTTETTVPKSPAAYVAPAPKVSATTKTSAAAPQPSEPVSPTTSPPPFDAGRTHPVADARLAATLDAPVKATLVDAGVAKPTLDAAKPKPDAATPKPDAATPKPASEGVANADALEDAVRTRSAQTNQCYETALKNDPTLSGTVTLSLKIDANGRVTSATADGLTEGLQSCIVAEVRKIKFPKPLDPPVSLIVPFRFERE